MIRILMVDGYNIIHAWPHLNRWKDEAGFAAARDRLVDELHDYGQFAGLHVVIVFDAYKGQRLQQSVERRSGMDIVYTAAGQTADRYIESTADALNGKDVELYVATSDRLQQNIVLGRGAVRVSAAELLQDVQSARRTRNRRQAGDAAQRLPLHQRLNRETLARLEHLRRGLMEDEH